MPELGGSLGQRVCCRLKEAKAGVEANQSLQQMVTVVTVRAKHGPRQPRPLLKLLLESEIGQCYAHLASLA